MSYYASKHNVTGEASTHFKLESDYATVLTLNSACSPGCYVDVVAQVKAVGGGMHLTAFNVRRVVDSNQSESNNVRIA